MIMLNDDAYSLNHAPQSFTRVTCFQPLPRLPWRGGHGSGSVKVPEATCHQRFERLVATLHDALATAVIPVHPTGRGRVRCIRAAKRREWRRTRHESWRIQECFLWFTAAISLVLVISLCSMDQFWAALTGFFIIARWSQDHARPRIIFHGNLQLLTGLTTNSTDST